MDPWRVRQAAPIVACGPWSRNRNYKLTTQPTPTVLTIRSMPFDENSYIAYFENSRECFIVDPGLEPDKIIAAIDQRQLLPVAILCTHGHADHIAGNGALKERWPDCELLIGTSDADMLLDPVANLSAGFGVELISPPADRTVDEGEILEIAGFRLEVFDTPGHSPGHVVFVARGLNPLQVFGGDVLFAGSVGRTDFPRGSFEELEQSIRSKLFPLPNETIVLPGHGPTTTIGKEKQTNPFVGESLQR